MKFKDGIAVKGITAKVNRDSRREYTRSNYSEALRKHDFDAYADKMRAASVADDVVIAATKWQRDGKLSKPRKAISRTLIEVKHLLCRAKINILPQF